MWQVHQVLTSEHLKASKSSDFGSKKVGIVRQRVQGINQPTTQAGRLPLGLVREDRSVKVLKVQQLGVLADAFD